MQSSHRTLLESSRLRQVADTTSPCELPLQSSKANANSLMHDLGVLGAKILERETTGTFSTFGFGK